MKHAISPERAILLIAVSIVIALIVLSSAITLLPAPPGDPTPTPPVFRLRPEDRHGIKPD